MNTKQAKNLKVGDIVRHSVDDVQGKVEHIYLDMLRIEWEDGAANCYLPSDMAEIHLVEGVRRGERQ